MSRPTPQYLSYIHIRTKKDKILFEETPKRKLGNMIRSRGSILLIMGFIYSGANSIFRRHQYVWSANDTEALSK